jgi:hypothetical protein
MVSVPLSRLQPSRTEEIEDWPWLDLAAGGAALFATQQRRPAAA